jgi:uncharacterized protein (DUF1330 family)
MQGSHKFALVLAVGFMLGAGAIQALHAQAKPPGYLLAEVAVKVDEATYKDSEFMKQTVPSIKAAGAKYLAGGFNNATALSGASPANRIVLLQFETFDKAKTWYADGQREREKELGSKVASSFRILAIEGANQ